MGFVRRSVASLRRIESPTIVNVREFTLRGQLKGGQKGSATVLDRKGKFRIFQEVVGEDPPSRSSGVAGNNMSAGAASSDK